MPTGPEKISFEEWNKRLDAQGQKLAHLAFKCPICGTVQSMTSLRKAGVPDDKLDTYLGFSCEGRWTNAGPWDSKKPERAAIRGCDWTLGGLFRLHKLEIEKDGETHPMFEIASVEEAAALRAAMEAETTA